MKKLRLSIVIPIYNEEENILKTLIAIKKHILVPYEIILVYDYDNDTTLPILNKIKYKFNYLYIIKNHIHPGPSGAIRTGIKMSNAPFILVTMADLCDDLSQVNKMMELVQDHVAIVCPSRYSKGGEQKLNARLKVWAPRIAGFLLKILAGIPTYDPTNSYKLYSKELLDRLTLTSTISFSVTLEIVVKAYSHGYKIIEIPTVWRDRQYGKTNFKLWRSIIAYLPWLLYALIHRKA